MEENLDRLYSLYYDAVSKSCHLFGMHDGAPFTLEEFIHQNQTLGFPICLINMILFLVQHDSHVILLYSIEIHYHFLFTSYISYN